MKKTNPAVVLARLLPHLSAAAILELLPLGLPAQPALTTSGPIVELPTYSVTDSRLVPSPESWRYGLAGKFEVLSNASDRSTKKVVADLLQFQQAVGIVWPAIGADSGLPTMLILCASKNKFAEFVPEDTHDALMGTVSLALRDRELEAIVINMQSSVLYVNAADDSNTMEDNLLGGSMGVTQNGASVAPPVNQAGMGAAAAAGVPTEGIEVNYSRQLHREYVHDLLSRIDPRPAPWLEEGLAQLFMSMQYSPDRIIFADLDDPNGLSLRQAVAANVNAETQHLEQIVLLRQACGTLKISAAEASAARRDECHAAW